MKIEKSSFIPGMFDASQTIEGQFYCGSDYTRDKAIERCIEKIIWVHGDKAFKSSVCENCGGDGYVEIMGDGEHFEWDCIGTKKCLDCNNE
jgi:hypothetical protein